VLVLNILVAAAKLLVGWITASISMVADGFHSLTDGASNIIGLIGVSWASSPPDDDHPYGHWKIETLAALLIGGLLAMTAWEVLKTSLGRLFSGDAPSVGTLSFVVMGSTLLVNVAVSSIEKRAGRRLGSQVLTADAAHTRSDVFVSLGVIVSLIAARAGLPEADVVAALVITGFIAHAAFQIVRRAAVPLVDTAAASAAEVEAVALSIPGVIGVHKVRSRVLPGGAHADLHVQVEPSLSIDKAHVIAHLVAERLESEMGLDDVVVHVEPPDDHRTDWMPDEPGSARD
jgi:cation diffusion facilitator family transporter